MLEYISGKLVPRQLLVTVFDPKNLTIKSASILSDPGNKVKLVKK